MTSYKAWLDKGYETLIPIAPPTAEVKDAGKRPAAYDARTGKWYGLTRWNGRRVDDEDPEVWQSWGANLGLVNDGSYFIVDIDSYDEEVGNQIERLARKMLGDAPRRVGQWPKRALLYRAADRIANFNLPYGEGRDRVETTSAGKQIVIAGTHPSGSPYTWDKDVPPKEYLPVVSGEQARAFFERLERGLPKAVLRTGSAEPAAPKDPEELKGDHDLIRRAVMAIPNGRDTGWDDYIALGQAIRGAFGPGYEEEAFEVWDQWAQSWPEGYEAELVRKHWDTMLPSRSLGAEYVLSRAGDQFLAHHFFTPQVSDLVSDMFAATANNEAKQDLPPLEPGRVDFDDLNLLPPRQWLYGYKVSRGYVTFVASPGGVGKTAWVTAAALACCKGEPLLHDKPVRPLKVWLMNLEDDRIEMLRRIKAAVSHYGLDQEVFENLRINSGRDRRFIVAKQQGGEKGSVVAMPDYAAVIEVMRREAIDILIVDPYLRSHGVSENSTEGQDEVMRLYTQIAHETKAGVILVHHFKKGGAGGDMDSMRGSSTQGGSARSVLTLTPMSVEEAAKAGVDEMQRRLHVRIDDAKNNMAPPMAKAEWIKLHSVSLGNGDETYPEGDKVQVATEWKLPGAWDGVSASALAGDTGFPAEVDMVELEALKAIDRGPADAVGERFAPKSQAGERWVGNLLVQHFGRSKAQAVEILRVWEKKGWIENVDYMSAAQRKTRKGVAVVWDKVSVNLGVFD